MVLIDLYKPRNIEDEILTLGKLYRREEKAREYVDFLNRYKNLVKERTGDIPRNERPRVYLENYSDYSTSSSAAESMNDLLESAACINIAADLPAPYPRISDEWILEQRPDIIIKNCSSTAGILGPDIYDDTFAAKEYKRLASRLGWANLPALKNHKFIILSSIITTSPEGPAIGALIIAKTAYPDRFRDIDPLEIYADIRRRFLRDESPAGILVYPWEEN